MIVLSLLLLKIFAIVLEFTQSSVSCIIFKQLSLQHAISTDYCIYIYIVFPYWCLKYWCGHNFCVFIFEMTSVRSFFKWCWLILLNLFTEMRGKVNNMVISLMNYIYVYLSFLYIQLLTIHASYKAHSSFFLTISWLCSVFVYITYDTR